MTTNDEASRPLAGRHGPTDSALVAGPSLAGRAALAVLLLVGFYALALAIAAALLYVPYAEVTYLHRVNGRITIFCIVGALAILWAILPRPDRFPPPGPVLTPRDHPRLFTALDDVARAAGQSMPREVYLVPDMNAWVAQRGGIMGVGSRRVMGLGLPLLQTLTISQIRSVLAHEFGHYHGGDTALGPWIYKTRAAIGRTLESLSHHSATLMKPFEWYGKAFLRITHTISRRQEFAADALAARVTGTTTTIEALKAVHGAGMVFEPYWHSEVVPALEKGYHPPIADGFRQFVGAPAISTGVATVLDQEMAEGKADPYDTHPPLRERIAALRRTALPARGGTDDDVAAISLLEDLPALERSLLDGMLRDDLRGKLSPVTWDEAGERVWVPAWREQVRAHSEHLAGLTPNMLPTLATDRGGLAKTLGLVRDRGAADGAVMQQAAHVVGAAIAVALHARGFVVRALPGHSVVLERGEISLAPFDAIGALASGALSAEMWRDQCARAEIASLDLGA